MPGIMFLLVGALTNCRNAPIKKNSRIWPLCRFSCLRFSPKSGRVFGPRQTNFILPSLRNDETRRRLQEPYNLHDPDEGFRPVGFRTGACWGITYQQGNLAIYHSVDDLPLELLEVVHLGCMGSDRFVKTLADGIWSGP